jgi:hypothetical protein
MARSQIYRSLSQSEQTVGLWSEQALVPVRVAWCVAKERLRTRLLGFARQHHDGARIS